MSRPDPRIDVAAEALWLDRKAGVTDWRHMSWREFIEKRPDHAALYRDNARIMIEALDKALVS